MEFTINNIFETNILNLIVVITVVVNVIGDAANSFLNDRQKKIMDQFTDADRERDIANKRLEDAQLALETAKQYAHAIPTKYRALAREETLKDHQRLESELQRIETEYILTAQRKKQYKVKAVGCALIDVAMAKAEKIMITRCRTMSQDQDRLKLDKYTR